VNQKRHFIQPATTTTAPRVAAATPTVTIEGETFDSMAPDIYYLFFYVFGTNIKM
jgi:hypothetical protein